MRPAIVHKDDEIYVEITPEDFIVFLSHELEVDENKVRQAINRVIVDLKQKTLYK